MICDTVYRIRPNTEMVRPHYMAIAMSSPSVAADIDRAKAGISESGVSLTHDRLGAIKVPIPSLEEQAAIETEIDLRMEVVGRTCADIDVQLGRASRLRQAVLKRAFEGKVVPQDPNDESASSLLARTRNSTDATSSAAPRVRAARPRSTARRERT